MHTVYQHGGDIYSNQVSMDYSANINPLGLPEGVKKALIQCINDQTCCVYPDSQCRELVKALSIHHQVPEDWILCGDGAADLIFGLAFALKPRKALLLAPSFLEYEQALKAVNCEISLFYLKEENGYRLNVDELCRKVEQTSTISEPAFDILFLCNPNNPTGIAVEKEQVLKLAETCERTGTFLVVDECFEEFLDEPEKYSIIPFLEEFPHVFVLKAFTKIYAMAGMRLGYALCNNEKVLSKVCQVRQPWSVSGPAQKAGIAALKETEYVLRTRKLIHEQREVMEDALKKLGFQVFPSQANYIFFRDPFKENQESLYSRMLKQGVLIRSCANYPGLDPFCYRICIKTARKN